VTEPTRLAVPEIVTVYGVDTCDDTTRARDHFDVAGLPYRYVNMDLDLAARAQVHAAGYFATPVVLTPAGRLFVEPSDEELRGIVAGL
jgi:glutaredoxin